LASCGTNITDIIWTNGNHNVTIWINDTSNNVNSSYVNFTVDASECQTLSTPNSVYTLTNKVSSSGTCFTISAENVTLDCAGYLINFSTSGGASQRGVYSNQNYTKIYNCTISDGNLSSLGSGRNGIYLNTINHGELINNNISVFSSSSVGIYLSSSSNNTLTKNNGTSNSSYGIYLYSSLNNNLTENNGESNSSYGIYLSTSSNYNTLFLNRGISVSNRAFYVLSSSWNNFTENIGTSASSQGIYVLSSSWNNFTENIGTSVSNEGIYISSSSNNTFVSNTGNSSTSVGIYVLSSLGNTFSRDFALSENYRGLQLYASDYNSFVGLNASVSSGGYGIFFYNSSMNNFTDCIEINGGTGIYADSDNARIETNSFLNCTYSGESIQSGHNLSLIRKWHIQNIVNDSSGFLEDAAINITNSSSVNVFSSFTNSTGETTPLIYNAIEYVQNETDKYYATPHVVNVSKAGYTENLTAYNLTSLGDGNTTGRNVFRWVVLGAGDSTAPELAITTPQNNSVIHDIYQDINYTYTDEGDVDSCWYTNDSGAVNTTLASCGTNITDIIWTNGNHNVTIWINDTSNNVNSSYVNFVVTTLELEITDPTTSSPVSVSGGDNISINFNLLRESVNVTSGVNLENVTIGGVLSDFVPSKLNQTEIEFETFSTDLGNWDTYYASDTGCVWQQDDDGTPSLDTGPCGGVADCPTDDAGYDDNFYAYVETSGSDCNTATGHAYLQYNDTDMDTYSNVNFSFAYSMYGADMGNLSFQIDDGAGGWISLWSLAGDQGTAWGVVEIDLSSYSGTRDIRFDYDRNGNNGYWGDVAVDVLNVTDLPGENEFDYFGNLGWQVNITVPNGLSGLQDLYLNVTYLENVVADTQTEAVDYGGVAPNNPAPILVSVDGNNQTASDLNCSSLITDNDSGDLLNVTIQWIKNDVLNLTIDYNNSYVNATMFSAILDSGNTTKTDNWTCGMMLYDGTDYSNWINSSDLEILNTLPTATLVGPANNNVTTNRTQLFTWSGNDDDNDALTYQINISLHDTGSPGSPCSDSDRNDTGIINEYYIPSSYMNCLQDNNYYYNWTVRASDDSGATYGGWATEWRVDYQSEVLITLINDTVSFGPIAQGGASNTTTNNPYPFLIQNDGNCFSNITINATDLWNTISNPSSYFRYKIDNYTGEEGSFNWGQSQTSWSDVPNSTQEMAIVRIDWDDSTDSAEVDLLVEVPNNEGSGSRESTVNFEASLGG
jgi:parallel beta-helix repeat protein